MKEKTEYLGVGVSVALLLLCVFAGVASAITIHDNAMVVNARETINLNGNWDYEPSNNENEPPSSWNHYIQVPGLVDLAQPKVDWENYDYHWYKTNFTPSQQHDHVFIKIGQSMFGTEVWLNDVHIGNDTSCFTSQEYDVSTVIDHSGENTLVVRVGSLDALPENDYMKNTSL